MTALISSELAILVYWIREREHIRQAKGAGRPRPWTDDTLLRDYRWCNVSRMDDRVSVELMRSWYSEADPSTQIVAASLGRLINWPEALLDASNGKPFCLALMPRMRAALHARADRGEKVFTGAYIVPGVPGRSKIDSVMDLVENIARLADWLMRPTLRETWQGFIGLDGLGSFLAGQIVADVAQLSSGTAWPDRFTWAPVGPGSARGMNRLRGRTKNQAVPQLQFDRELGELIDDLTLTIAPIAQERRMCAQDYQSCCCEFDKYRRLTLGEGTVRARYAGAGAAEQALLL